VHPLGAGWRGLPVRLPVNAGARAALGPCPPDLVDHRSVDVGGTRPACRVSGPPLVLVHALGRTPSLGRGGAGSRPQGAARGRTRGVPGSGLGVPAGAGGRPSRRPGSASENPPRQERS